MGLNNFDKFNRRLYSPSGMSSGSGRRARKKQIKAGWLVVIDILCIGIALCIFSVFHHVLPRANNSTPLKVISKPTQKPSGTPNGTQNPDATTEPDDQSWGIKFKDKFTEGDIEKTANSYKSKDINVTLNKVEEDGITYYLADIYIRNIENFKTALAKDQYGKAIREDTTELAKRKNAIIAMNGDYYGNRDNGVVIRNGVLYRDDIFEDACVLYYDGTMETYSPEEFNIDEIVAKSPYQAWSFGPMLLDNGEAMTEFNTNVPSANPRSAIGYYEPGHYAFLLVDGRQEGYSKGMTMTRMSQLFHDLGCKTAYNLDGGQTSVMAFMGETANRPYNGGRSCSDILYIGEME